MLNLVLTVSVKFNYHTYIHFENIIPYREINNCNSVSIIMLIKLW